MTHKALASSHPIGYFFVWGDYRSFGYRAPFFLSKVIVLIRDRPGTYVPGGAYLSAVVICGLASVLGFRHKLN